MASTLGNTHTVTPWEVKGKVYYARLMQEFGLQPLRHLPKQFLVQPLFRRGLVFAHRDFKQIAEAVEQKKPFVMMTGLMPSGKFHFGHKLVADQIVFYWIGCYWSYCISITLLKITLI